VDAFDYVIVGAGSAGCVLANRLSEDPRCEVLLLEAGPRDTHFWIHVPLGYGKLFAKSALNWGYESEPEPALNGRRIFTPRGKVLGGSSSINGLVYIRGQPQDYDGWGVLGWDFASLLPYFRKAEDHCLGESAWHGAGGPLAVSALGRHALCDAFISSANALGIARNDDFNGAAQEGAGYYHATTRNARRCSTAVGYLRPAEKRPNLQVRTGTLATRIVFQERKAIGVQIGDRVLKARREVVVCGGAFNSPQLLQLSGIGPRALLERHAIAVLQEAPVGEGLQDQAVGVIHECHAKDEAEHEHGARNPLGRRTGRSSHSIYASHGYCQIGLGQAIVSQGLQSFLGMRFPFIPKDAAHESI